LVKRYVKEEGSQELDRLYKKGYSGEVEMVVSLWNIGEFMGVLDKYKNRKEISSETESLLGRKAMTLEYLDPNLLSSSWALILKHGIYAADAIQIVSAHLNSCDCFLSGDRKLVDIARREGLEAVNVEKERIPL